MTDAAGLNLVKSRSLPEQIADAIIEGIVTGVLNPGQRLIELDLARSFAVSRMPLREALKTLEAQGIIERAPHRGVRVVELGDVRIDRICEVRGALEAIAARAAAIAYRAEPDRLRGVEAALERMGEAVGRGDWAAVNKADLVFHREICIASGNDVVLTLWEGLARHVWMIFSREILTEGGRAQIICQHRNFLTALLDAEAEAVPLLVERHIMRLRRPTR